MACHNNYNYNYSFQQCRLLQYCHPNFEFYYRDRPRYGTECERLVNVRRSGEGFVMLGLWQAWDKWQIINSIHSLWCECRTLQGSQAQFSINICSLTKTRLRAIQGKVWTLSGNSLLRLSSWLSYYALCFDSGRNLELLEFLSPQYGYCIQ